MHQLGQQLAQKAACTQLWQTCQQAWMCTVTSLQQQVAVTQGKLAMGGVGLLPFQWVKQLHGPVLITFLA
jgi:ABC-type arginine/histidine transport system permease subunit